MLTTRRALPAVRVATTGRRAAGGAVRVHSWFGRGNKEEQPTVKGRNGAKKWDRIESEGTATSGRSKHVEKELGRGIGKFYTAPAPITGGAGSPNPAVSLAPWAAAGATVIAGGYLGMRAMRGWATQRWKDTLTAEESELKQVSGDSMDTFVADMTTNLVGVDRDQMSAALSDAKNKEVRLAKAQALVEEMRTKADAMQTRLRQQLEEREEQLAAALEAAEALEAEVQAVNQVVEAQEAEIDAVKMAAAEHAVAAQGALEESQRRVALLEAMVGTLRQQLTTEESKSSVLEDKLKEGEEALLEANSRAEEMERKVRGLEHDLEGAERRFQEATDAARELGERVKAMEDEKTGLISTIDKLREASVEQGQMASAAAEEAEGRLAEVVGRSEASEAAIKRMEVALEAANKDLRSAEEAAEQRMASKVAEMAKMEQSYQEQQQQAEVALKQSQEDAEKLEVQLSGALEQVSEKEGELDGLRRVAEEAQGRAEAAQGAAAAVSEDVRAAKAEVSQLEETVRRNRLELAEAKRQGLSQANELQEENIRQEAELADMQMMVSKMAEDSEAVSRTSKERDAQLAKAKHLVAQRETELEAVRALVKTRDQKAKENLSRMRDSEVAVMRLKALVAEREAVMEQLQRRVQEGGQAVQAARGELQEARSTARAEAVARTQEVDTLRQQLRSATSSAQEQLGRQRSELQQLAESYERRLADAEEELRERRRAEAEEEAEVTAAERAADERAANITRLKGEVRMMEGTLKQVEDEARSLLKGAAKEQEAALRKELQALRGKKDDQSPEAQQAMERGEAAQLLLLRSGMNGVLAQRESRVRAQLQEARPALERLLEEQEAPEAEAGALKDALAELKAREAALALREEALKEVQQGAAAEAVAKQTGEQAQTAEQWQALQAQLQELKAFQSDMRSQEQGLKEVRQQYDVELKAAQRGAAEAAREASELRAEVERRDSELGSLRAAAGALPSAAALVFQALEDEAVVGATLSAAQRAVTQAGGEIASAVVKAAAEGGAAAAAAAATVGQPSDSQPRASDAGTNGASMSQKDGDNGNGNGTSNGNGSSSAAAPPPPPPPPPPSAATAAPSPEQAEEPAPSTGLHVSMDELSASLWGTAKPSEAAAATAATAATATTTTATATEAGAAAAAAPGGSVKTAKGSPRGATLSLLCAGYVIPHPDKVDKGGEDAFFVTPGGAGVEGGADGEPWLGALGIADGVGGWSDDGIDPGEYANTLMEVAAREAGPPAGLAPQQVLHEAQMATDLPGSATACVMLMRPGGRLSAANIGDSSFRIIRAGKVVAKAKPQQHEFNMPFQLAHPLEFPETDLADDAQLYELPVQPRDVVVAGSDGLFDNMWDEQLCEIVAEFLNKAAVTRSNEDALALAKRLADAASANASDTNYRSPFAVEAAEAGIGPLISRMFPRGGKLDDTTVVVGFLEDL